MSALAVPEIWKMKECLKSEVKVLKLIYLYWAKEDTIARQFTP